MSLNLEKGARLDLTKGTNIKNIKVCLGWEANAIGNNEFDLDASAFVLNKDGKLTGNEDVVFYNQLEHPSKAIKSLGDDRSGKGDITHSNDKEIIIVDLTKVPPTKDKIAFVITIYKAKERMQNFGQVKNAFIRIVNADGNSEVMRYDLTENYSTATALIAAEVYRKDNEWKVAAIGEGKTGGLEDLLKIYGLTNP